MKTSILRLALLCLAVWAVAACAGSPTPPPIAGNPSIPAPPTMEGEVETPLPAVASVTAVAVPTTPKPTATFVPLITPSPTPTGDQPGRASVRRIGVAEARALAEAGGAVLVDVRTRGTYEQAHIAGALSMPLDEIAERAHELADEALIIFYCA